MATSSSRATRHRADQTKLARLLAAEVAPLVAPQPNRTAVQALIQMLAALVGQYHRASSSLAATYYEQERAAAGIRQRFTLPLADPPPLEQLTHSFGWATRDLTDGAVNLDAVLTRTEGAAARHAMSGGRDTIVTAVTADRQATGWVRVAQPDACAFCALLATRVESKGRGGAYRSEQTALFQQNGDKYHDHCRCTARPVFKGQTYEPDAHARAWADLYRDTTGHVGGADKLPAFRAALTAQRAEP